jgi:hypothetical protein
MHQAGIQHANDVNILWTLLLAEAKGQQRKYQPDHPGPIGLIWLLS